MNLFELLQLVNKTKDNEDWVDIHFIANELFIDPCFNFAENTRLTSYWLKSWMCTDTMVGDKVFYLDEEPVMVSSKSGRKCDTFTKWVSKDAAKAVHEYVTSLIQDEAHHGLTIAEDIDFKNGYRLSYTSQIMRHHTVARYMATDEIVKIVEIPQGIAMTDVTVMKENGEKIEVHLHGLVFPYHITENNGGAVETNDL